MNKNNFLNFKEKNIWDIGWPCSPRFFCMIMTIIVAIIMMITLI